MGYLTRQMTMNKKDFISNKETINSLLCITIMYLWTMVVLAGRAIKCSNDPEREHMYDQATLLTKTTITNMFNLIK